MQDSLTLGAFEGMMEATRWRRGVVAHMAVARELVAHSWLWAFGSRGSCRP